MKKIIIILLAVTILSCYSDKSKSGKLTDFVPENTAVFFRMNSLKTIETDLKNNGFINNFSNFEAYHFFSEEVQLSEYINPISEVLLAVGQYPEVSEESQYHYTFITRQHPNLFVLDSLKNKKIETITVDKNSYQQISLENATLYSVVKDSVFVLSSSPKIIQAVFEKERKQDEILQKIYATGTTQSLTVFINVKNFMPIFNHRFSNILPQDPLSSWISLDTDIHPDILKLNGVALSDNAEQQFLHIFKGTSPQKNLLAKVTPVTASGFVSYTFDDFDILSQNLQPFQPQDSMTLNTAFFQSINEVGVIYLNNEKMIAADAIDGNISEESIAFYWNEHSSFRDVSIKKVTDSTFFNRAFYPLIQDSNPVFGIRLDNFFVFSEKENTLHEIITEYTNETTLGFRPFYEEHQAQLSSESSVLMVALNTNLKERLKGKGTEAGQKEMTGLKISGYPMAAIQLVYDGHFAHVNGVVKGTQQGTRSTGVSQQFAIQLENELLNTPQFFTNHVTKGKDIVVQDVKNKLYLISSSGKVLWNKQLDGPILGKINEIDLVKNGRTQLAFTTPKAFYVLDRNGKEVAPFPLKFKDEITLPLAVFDYDNKRDYRFVITQESNMLMYDSKAKIVSGFTFKKAGSKVVLTPQHIRLNNKDYLLIAEENGKLNILHRTGANRVEISTKLDFGKTPFYAENDQFVFISANNEKVTINQNGKVSKTDLKSASHAYLVTLGKTVVLLNDNILKINAHRVELPYGTYTEPVISLSNKRILISVTDTQQQRVYTYNSLGELLNNFPVYGTSVMEFEDANSNGRPNGVVKGAGNEVILYEVN